MARGSWLVNMLFLAPRATGLVPSAELDGACTDAVSSGSWAEQDLAVFEVPFK